MKIQTLSCGCCGHTFKTWEGYEDQDQDAGYGICRDCQESAELAYDAQMDNYIAKLAGAFEKPENKEKFLKFSREAQEGFVLKMVQDGAAKFVVNKS